MPILESIRELLTGRGIAFAVVQHEPTFTSEQSAAARGESLRIGGKALLMRCDDEFALFVLPADRKIDSGAVRRTLPANGCGSHRRQNSSNSPAWFPAAFPRSAGRCFPSRSMSIRRSNRMSA